MLLFIVSSLSLADGLEVQLQRLSSHIHQYIRIAIVQICQSNEPVNCWLPVIHNTEFTVSFAISNKYSRTPI